jgi:hypothetical protein
MGARPNAPGPCLHYLHEKLSQSDGRTRVPEEVTLSGELIERTYWGPPNWGEHPDTDRLEDAWLLVLDRPVCVDADPSWVNNVSESNVIVVQLVVLDAGPDNKALKNVARLVNRHVTVSGFLDHALTGHHRTPVLFMVASIAPSNNRWRGP